MAKDKIKLSVDFVAGNILIKAMRYYIENFGDAVKDLEDAAEKAGEDKSEVVVLFGLAAAESLDGIRNQIRKKGKRAGWGSDEHRSNWCNEKEKEGLPSPRRC